MAANLADLKPELAADFQGADAAIQHVHQQMIADLEQVEPLCQALKRRQEAAHGVIEALGQLKKSSDEFNEAGEEVSRLMRELCNGSPRLDVSLTTGDDTNSIAPEPAGLRDAGFLTTSRRSSRW